MLSFRHSSRQLIAHPIKTACFVLHSAQTAPGGRCNLAQQYLQGESVPFLNNILVQASINRDLMAPEAKHYPRTFYRRVLPTPPAVQFSSDQGKQLFAEALSDGTMEGFFKLIEQFRTQDEPAFCGLASLAMVLNSLSIDPRRPWKGPWRDFHEAMLDCCHPLSKIAEEGVTLQQVQCLALCNGATVQMMRQDEVTLEQFRRLVSQSCSTDQQHMIVSYSRKTFLQTGDGHFSPVGGYHAARDLVLILDTARFKYPPHWVPLPMLYEAMGPLDPVTQRPRGLLLLTPSPRPNSVLFTIDRTTTVATFLKDTLPTIVTPHTKTPHTSAPDTLGHALLQNILEAVPSETVDVLACRQPVPHPNGCEEHGRSTCTPTSAIDQLLHEVHASELFKTLEHVDAAPWPLKGQPLALERAAMLLWMADATVWKGAEAIQGLQHMMKLLPGSNVAVEVAFIKEQLQQAPMLDRDMELAAACSLCANGGCGCRDEDAQQAELV